MKQSFKTGLSFGLTSGVITTLGLLTGLSYSSGSRVVVVAGIITIAIADAFSDALGIHLSTETNSKNSDRDVWESTAATFIAKFIVALTFIPLVIFLSLKTAVMASVGWGLFLLVILSYYIAVKENKKPLLVIGEHLAIAIAVVLITAVVGNWIDSWFLGR